MPSTDARARRMEHSSIFGAIIFDYPIPGIQQKFTQVQTKDWDLAKNFAGLVSCTTSIMILSKMMLGMHCLEMAKILHTAALTRLDVAAVMGVSRHGGRMVKNSGCAIQAKTVADLRKYPNRSYVS